MPHDARSLLGFMDQQVALAYMTNACKFPNSDPAVLTQEWQTAQQQLGPAIPNAGYPQVKPLAHPHLAAVTANPHFDVFFGNAQWEFAVVEVAALLAYQFHVLTGPAQQHCAGLPNNPTVNDMLPVCLPPTFSPPAFDTYIQPQGVLVEAADLDVAVFGQGKILLRPDPAFQVMVAGLVYGHPNPWVVVAEYQGRYYLSNGYHRVYGLSQRGASVVPCILIHAANTEQVGIKGRGNTFDEALLTSANPPTCGHFASNRAYAIDVRHIRRFLAVNWSAWDLHEP